LKNVIVILLITLALLFAFEIILRVIFPEKTMTLIRPRPLAYEFNKDYLVSLKPNLEKTYVSKESDSSDVIYWRTNKDSFRGNDLKENRQFRIIVYGDSNVEARFSKLENTFVYKLERYLQESGIKSIEAINAGVAGFGPDQSLIRFAKEIDIYNPNIVIFHIFADNDFGDIIRNRLFELDSDGNLIETGHRKTIDPLLKEKPDFIDFVSSLRIVKGIRNLKSFAIREETVKRKTEDPVESLIQQYQSYIKQEYSVYKQSKPRYFSVFADYYDLDVALFPDAESSKTKIKLMDGIIKRARNIADSKRVYFIVLIQPSIIDLTKNITLSYEHLQKYPGYKKTNLTNAVKNICISNNIDFVNLFDIFSKNNPEVLFYKGKTHHWNDQGQEVAAKETALYIINKIIPKNHSLTIRFRQGATDSH